MIMLTMAGAMSAKEERQREDTIVNVISRRGTECISKWSLKKLNIAAVAKKANETPVHVPNAKDTSCPSTES